eukprot:3931813-Rhodomonas_salina.1
MPLVWSKGFEGGLRQLLVCDTHLPGLRGGCLNAPEDNSVTLPWFDVHDQQVLAQGFVTNRSAHAEDEREGVHAPDLGAPGCTVADGLLCAAVLFSLSFLSALEA